MGNGIDLKWAKSSGQVSRYLSIQDYEIIEPLGRGATSYVYRVKNRLNSQEYALKVVEKDKLRTATLVKRLQTEISIQSSLSHPNVLPLLHHFEDQSNFYLVLEFCPGGELFHHLHSQGRLTETETRVLCGQLVEGVAYLHAQRVMHRDLKLGNLLLNAECTHLKIADFGLAKVLQTAEEESGTVCGTPNYIPPEIVCHQPHGLSVDLWSLGCIVYACLAGQPPFESATIPATLSNIKDMQFGVPEEWSLAAKSLVTSLLVWEKRERLSIQAVLKHPFFQGYFAQKEETMRASQSKSALNIDTDCSFYDYKESFLSPANNVRISHKTQPAALTSRLQPSDMQVKATPLRRRHTSAIRHRPTHTESSVTLETGKLPPLDTTHLIPIRHEIKNGYVEIAGNGGVTVQTGKRRIEISNDGMQVWYNGQAMSLGCLTPSAAKLYEYASTFVTTVKGKTPKVTHQDGFGTYLLMWNSPPNFEAVFTDGVRVLYQVGAGEMTVQLRSGQQAKVDPYSESQENRKLQRWVDQSLAGMMACLKLEKDLKRN